METGFPILLLCLAGLLLLYAGLIAATGDASLIFRSYAAKMKDRKAYARQFGKLLAVVAIAPAVSGEVGLLCGSAAASGILLVPTFLLCLRAGLRLMKDVTDE